jgi:putative addiction module component (TIGR02574 family)
MSQTLLKTALELSRAERILLAERLWDSVAEEADPAPRLSAVQEAELERRLQRLKKTGPLGSDWETVKKRIVHQHVQTADRRA